MESKFGDSFVFSFYNSQCSCLEESICLVSVTMAEYPTWVLGMTKSIK